MAAIPKMIWILLKFYLCMGGMLTNNTLREILSNMIPNFTYSTNEGQRERDRQTEREKQRENSIQKK